ncbi:MAG: hypothetical protein Kow0031_04630 [Anaerolineae bacterium]
MTVTAVNDALVEGAHTGVISHGISSADLVYPRVVVSNVVAAILDDDVLPALVISDVTVAEDVGTAVITVSLSGGRNAYGASVSYTFGGGTADSGDYSAGSGTLTWPATTSGTQTITATIIDDEYGELTETVVITLSAPVSATIVNGSAVLTITDNDAAPNLSIAKTVALSGTVAWPGDPLTYTLVVSNSGGSANNVAVTDSLPAALAGDDFTWTGVVTANSAVTHTIAATINADAGYGVFILNTGTVSHSSGFDSGTAGFATISDTVAPDISAARLITPTGLITETPRPVFVWDGFVDAVSGIISYTLRITSSNDSFSLQEVTQEITTTSPVYTPTTDLPTGFYTWTVRAHDAAGNISGWVMPPYTFTIQAETGDIYLPLIMRAFAPGPDLVIDDLEATSSQVTVTIRNAGTEPVVDAFWVDVYFNPGQTPGLNQPWKTIAPAGVVWGVTQSLAPGETLVLVSGGAYYAGPPDSSSSFPAGATVYAYVDSINYDTNYGNVKEANEGNNLSTPSISTAGGEAIIFSGEPTLPPGLPAR